MARHSTAYDDTASWSGERDDDKFITSATGKTLRKFDGSYQDAEDVLDWAIRAGWDGEVLDAAYDEKTLRLLHPTDNPSVDLVKGQYLVLVDGAFSTMWPAYAAGDVVDEFGQI